MSTVEEDFIELFTAFANDQNENHDTSWVLISMRDTPEELIDTRVKPKVIGPNHAAASIAGLIHAYIKIDSENGHGDSEFTRDLTKLLAYVESTTQRNTKQ